MKPLHFNFFSEVASTLRNDLEEEEKHMLGVISRLTMVLAAVHLTPAYMGFKFHL